MDIFRSRVVAVGPEAGELLGAGILILFGPSAPPELRQVAVIHAPGIVSGPLAPGQHLWLGGQAYTVTGVGARAEANLRALGHLVVKFDGRAAPELPGDLCVEARPAPPLAPGVPIRIEASCAEAADAGAAAARVEPAGRPGPVADGEEGATC